MLARVWGWEVRWGEAAHPFDTGTDGWVSTRRSVDASWRDGSTVRYVSTSCVLIALRGVFAFGEAEPSTGGLALVVPSGTAEKAAPPAISARGPLGGLAWPGLELPRMHLEVNGAPPRCGEVGSTKPCAVARGPLRAVPVDRLR